MTIFPLWVVGTDQVKQSFLVWMLLTLLSRKWERVQVEYSLLFVEDSMKSDFSHHLKSPHFVLYQRKHFNGQHVV